MRWSKIPDENLHGTFFAIVKVDESRSRYDANGGGRDEYCDPSIAIAKGGREPSPMTAAMRLAQE